MSGASKTNGRTQNTPASQASRSIQDGGQDGEPTKLYSLYVPRKGNDSASLLVRYCIAEKCIVATLLTNVKQLQPQVTSGLQPVSATTLLQVLVLRRLI